MPDISITPYLLIPSESRIIGRLFVKVTYAKNEIPSSDNPPTCSCPSCAWESDPVVMHVSRKETSHPSGGVVVEYQMAVFFSRYCKKFEVLVSLPHSNARATRTHFPAYWANDFAALSQSADNPRYPQWLAAHADDVAAHLDTPSAASKDSPIFLIALHGSREEKKIQATLDSLLGQTYGSWLVMLPKCDAASAIVSRMPGEARILITSPETPLLPFLCGTAAPGGAELPNEFSALIETGSTLHPQALAAFASAIVAEDGFDAAYCDSDALDGDKTHSDPWFKPDFNLDLLRSCPYASGLFVARKSLIGDFKPARYRSIGAQGYSFTLVASEKARKVAHIPYMLFRKGTPPAQTVAASRQELREALQDHLDRVYPGAIAERGLLPHTNFVAYPVQGEPLVSIIIPSKDQGDMLQRCVKSITEKAGYDHYEILIIENNSADDQTFALYEQLQDDYEKLRVVTYEADGPFNYSAIINHGVQEARGEYILTLNNDTCAMTPGFVARMLGCCQRPEVGVVGARLLYPDRTIQHAGMVVTFGNPGIDPVLSLFANVPVDSPSYAGLTVTTRDCSVVTGACQMFSRATFDLVGGYEEELATAFNDADFCLKARATGQLVVYDASVELLHFESASFGNDSEVRTKRGRAAHERAWMHEHWGSQYADGDPYFNRSFDQFNAYCKIAYPRNPQWFTNGAARQARRTLGKAADFVTYRRRK